MDIEQGADRRDTTEMGGTEALYVRHKPEEDLGLSSSRMLRTSMVRPRPWRHSEDWVWTLWEMEVLCASGCQQFTTPLTGFKIYWTTRRKLFASEREVNIFPFIFFPVTFHARALANA